MNKNLMKTKNWCYTSDNGKQHKVELLIWFNNGKTKIIIDGSIVLQQKFKIFRQDKIYLFVTDCEKIEIEINDKLPYLNTDENDKLKYDCYINGISLNFGTGKKSEEVKLLEKIRQEQKAWEQIQSRGFMNYLLSQLKFNMLVAITSTTILMFILYFQFGEKLIISNILYLFGMMLFLEIINIRYWMENCKKYKNSKT
jgi:hypothetical protein